MSNKNTKELVWTPNQSIDSMNLTEFAFATLGSSKCSSMVFRDTRPEDGKLVVMEWEVVGSAKHGLPNSWDEGLALVLMQITQEKIFHDAQSHTVPVTRYEILGRMGLDRNAYYYDRILNGLERLKEVSIHARNAFRVKIDDKLIYLPQVSFGIINRFVVANDTRHSQLSSITWSDEIFESVFSDQYIKSIDLGLYFHLNKDVSRRLYRFLDKRRNRSKDLVAIPLMPLCHEHLAMSRSQRYISQLRDTLDLSHQELIQADYLSEVEYIEKSDGPYVLYTFGRRAK